MRYEQTTDELWPEDVHHDVHARELRPHLERCTESDTTGDTRAEEVEVGLGALSTLKADLLLDLVEFEPPHLINHSLHAQMKPPPPSHR